jgi:hypothetical protein
MLLREEEVVLHHWSFVRWTLNQKWVEQTFYSRRPWKRTGVPTTKAEQEQENLKMRIEE